MVIDLAEFFENSTSPEVCILVSVDTGDFDAFVSIDELEELAHTAGAEVFAKLIQSFYFFLEEELEATFFLEERLLLLEAGLKLISPWGREATTLAGMAMRCAAGSFSVLRYIF